MCHPLQLDVRCSNVSPGSIYSPSLPPIQKPNCVSSRFHHLMLQPWNPIPNPSPLHPKKDRMAPGWIGAWTRGRTGGHRKGYIQPPPNLLKSCGLWVWPSARCYCLLHCFIPIDRRCSWLLSIMSFYKHSGKKENIISALLLLLYLHWKFWWTVFGLCCFFYSDFSMILSSLNVDVNPKCKVWMRKFQVNCN